MFITIDNNGIVQTFIYNLTMQEAMEKVEKEGYPVSSSNGSYHHNQSHVAATDPSVTSDLNQPRITPDQ